MIVALTGHCSISRPCAGMARSSFLTGTGSWGKHQCERAGDSCPVTVLDDFSDLDLQECVGTMNRRLRNFILG
jgi:hypothetical protein